MDMRVIAPPAGLLLVLGILSGAPARGGEREEVGSVQVDADSPFASRLLEIAGEYERYGRVDDEVRWAPYLCRMPSPSRARLSASGDEETHGRKLYFIFAKDRTAYLSAGKQDSPVGQVVVKEAWKPVAVAGDEMLETIFKRWPKGKPTDERRKFSPLAAGDSLFPYAKLDGDVYKAGERAGLFIMFKTDPKTSGADEGWVYGTVSADGKRVTAAGRIESCIACHQDARRDRLFGMATLPLSHPLKPAEYGDVKGEGE